MIPIHKIGFDFDGVIADTAASFISIAHKKYGFTITESDITDFNIEKCTAIPEDTIISIFTEIMLDSVGTGVKPMIGAVDTLSAMAAQGPVTIITARPSIKAVKIWFASFFPEETCKNLNLIAMGDHDNKLRYIQEQGLEYFIDDRAETCQKLADAGLKPIVFHHPWNSGRHQLPMVHNWNHIAELVGLERS